ncbi:hypothetical protein K438DRAFT_1777363 [Mycena galopus ATCC 62051]|nr:hypothetical protein K438DRAFT_1777363 [Mycena galopus ATCC 62051]
MQFRQCHIIANSLFEFFPRLPEFPELKMSSSKDRPTRQSRRQEALVRYAAKSSTHAPASSNHSSCDNPCTSPKPVPEGREINGKLRSAAKYREKNRESIRAADALRRASGHRKSNGAEGYDERIQQPFVAKTQYPHEPRRPSLRPHSLTVNSKIKHCALETRHPSQSRADSESDSDTPDSADLEAPHSYTGPINREPTAGPDALVIEASVSEQVPAYPGISYVYVLLILREQVPTDFYDTEATPQICILGLPGFSEEKSNLILFCLESEVLQRANSLVPSPSSTCNCQSELYILSLSSFHLINCESHARFKLGIVVSFSRTLAACSAALHSEFELDL